MTELNKTLTDILKNKYIVPLYQRNFAWGEKEISQLLQDIYESFDKNSEGNYFIGSLVVLRRKNGDFEVIDGQQRLTAITLIAKLLNIEEIKEPKLFFDSRPEFEEFFKSFYKEGNTNNVVFDYKVSHLINAIDIINETKLNANDETSPSIKSLDPSRLKLFRTFFTEHLVFVLVEIPEDTDVANYFEIMNNRGDQLQKHETLKAKIIDKIKNADGQHNTTQQAIFAKIWDACSQMDIYIQKSFSTDKNIRNILFGNNYDLINVDKIEALDIENEFLEMKSLNDIILNHTVEIKIKNNITSQLNESIIDFPNFLMHIFKLLYNSHYQNVTKNEINIIGSSIPLNEKELLSVFEKIESKIDPMDFISKLLYFRTIFDRYIIRSSYSENSEDGFRWILKKPIKYEHLGYQNTFGQNQERIIKCLSMLQVTFRTRIYKNWLQDILSWFINDTNFYISEENYQSKLDELASKYYDNNLEYKEITISDYYSKGTATPHFLFNFIDYLYWIKLQKEEPKINYNFEFKYRNSVEHHLPQSFANNQNMNRIDCLGNLCLVSKSSNSRMNNEAPTGKADEKGKYYQSNLPPKQKIMYDKTNAEKKWSNNEIEQHYKEVVNLLESRKVLLNID